MKSTETIDLSHIHGVGDFGDKETGELFTCRWFNCYVAFLGVVEVEEE
jgi:hypothetical protein